MVANNFTETCQQPGEISYQEDFSENDAAKHGQDDKFRKQFGFEPLKD